jgi:CheY-like chemotaxis protein
MNAIIGMIAIAEATDEVDKIRYCLKKIDDSSVHLLGVINDILDISKIESGKFEVSFTNFNFERMLERLLAVIRFKLEEKNIEFNIFVDRNMPRRIISDEQRIAQVIANLLSNAVKFTPNNGKVTVLVNKIDTIGDVNNIQIIVKDTGIGLSDEHKEKLFKPFSQAENNTSRKYGGTGLGLAISKSIVEKLGGKIWVESILGQGSSFIFNILAETGTEEQSETLLDKQLADLRILAIDDQDETLRFFRGIGKKLKIKIDLAEDGYKALDLIKENHYDIAFVDWKMPGMNGIEVAKKIHEIEEESTILIMISALEWNEIEKEAREAGIKKFISKPLLMPIIEDALLDCIGKNKMDNKEDELINIFEGKHILLAEDVEINREIVYSLLEKTGLNIDSAENGEIAVKIFKENPNKYNLIFMDIQMPIMDGYVATTKIRALNEGNAKTIPIVAMTANVFKTDIEQALASGMNGHIGKPIDINEVTETLKKYLL